jgi:hypothetical protein
VGVMTVSMANVVSGRVDQLYACRIKKGRTTASA